MAPSYVVERPAYAEHCALSLMQGRLASEIDLKLHIVKVDPDTWLAVVCYRKAWSYARGELAHLTIAQALANLGELLKTTPFDSPYLEPLP